MTLLKSFVYTRTVLMFVSFFAMKPMIQICCYCLFRFIEVAPQDIPKVCPYDLQQTCLQKYGTANPPGEFEAGFLEVPCGSLRLMCWRSGLKFIIYSGKELPENTYYDETLNDRLKHFNMSSFIPMAELCQCMLTSNGTVPYPASAFTFRSDTDYFCTQLNNANSGMASCIVSTNGVHGGLGSA
eukprot:m.213863 g.213863  ORF g.213863 m.213863 type:complete len:184 (-) comp19063_c0_seq4:499-1050(-)